jgi:hypothetical protein
MIVVSAIIRFLLAVILFRAALHKLRDRSRFQAELAAYQLLPTRLLPLATPVLIVTEAFTALSLLNMAWGFPTFLAAALFFIYAVAMAINLLQGRTHIDCGCSGPLGASKKISWILVMRNAGLVFLALLCTLPTITTILSTPTLSTLDGFIILSGAVVSLLLYETIEQAIANAQGYQRWTH